MCGLSVEFFVFSLQFQFQILFIQDLYAFCTFVVLTQYTYFAPNNFAISTFDLLTSKPATFWTIRHFFRQNLTVSVSQLGVF